MNLQQHNISDNNFEQCIKCTVCTVYCPVAAVNPDFPGPHVQQLSKDRLDNVPVLNSDYIEIRAEGPVLF